MGNALQWARRRLNPSPTGSLDAAVLLAHVLDQSRPWVLAHGDEPLAPTDATQYSEIIEQRADGVPVAYLRGYVEWFGMALRVTPDVLIPRPETELLVEEALALARSRSSRVVVDVGTGSGAIALQLARSLPDATVVGIDVSASALEVARYNAAVWSPEHDILWLEGNLLAPLDYEPDLVVANLPYLSESMMNDLDRDVRHEPNLALCGGVDGLELYRELFWQRGARGWRSSFVLEIDPRQSSSLVNFLCAEVNTTQVRVKRDYAGHDRIVVVES